MAMPLFGASLCSIQIKACDWRSQVIFRCYRVTSHWMGKKICLYANKMMSVVRSNHMNYEIQDMQIVQVVLRHLTMTLSDDDLKLLSDV